jgi:hypothetical protein
LVGTFFLAPRPQRFMSFLTPILALEKGRDRFSSTHSESRAQPILIAIPACDYEAPSLFTFHSSCLAGLLCSVRQTSLKSGPK